MSNVRAHVSSPTSIPAEPYGAWVLLCLQPLARVPVAAGGSVLGIDRPAVLARTRTRRYRRLHRSVVDILEVLEWAKRTSVGDFRFVDARAIRGRSIPSWLATSVPKSAVFSASTIYNRIVSCTFCCGCALSSVARARALVCYL